MLHAAIHLTFLSSSAAAWLFSSLHPYSHHWDPHAHTLVLAPMCTLTGPLTHLSRSSVSAFFSPVALSSFSLSFVASLPSSCICAPPPTLLPSPLGCYHLSQPLSPLCPWFWTSRSWVRHLLPLCRSPQRTSLCSGFARNTVRSTRDHCIFSLQVHDKPLMMHFVISFLIQPPLVKGVFPPREMAGPDQWSPAPIFLGDLRPWEPQGKDSKLNLACLDL